MDLILKRNTHLFHGKALEQDQPQSQLKIWHWNINGLGAGVLKGHLLRFLENHQPDILCLNETKTDYQSILEKGIHEKLPLHYEQYWNCSKARRGYSGTGILTRIKPLNVKYDIDVQHHDQEGRVITAEFDKFILISVYVPNSGDGLRRLDYRTQEFDKDFHDYIDKVRIENKKPLILSGDMNVARKEIDIYDAKGKEKSACYTPEERASFESLIGRGYVDVYRHLYPDKQEFTYFSARIRGHELNKGWRIDYFIVPQKDVGIVIDTSVHKSIIGSDHVPIQLQIDLDKLQEEGKENKIEQLIVNQADNNKQIKKSMEALSIPSRKQKQVDTEKVSKIKTKEMLKSKKQEK
ncbi:exodeoxyribonuclease iii family protein [Stylonychia lemnae]|uniref:Exodeoxyribonuclease iii family protein n=1 Tax=Stylonychia lemnae TaxID=5949 RepID=A0A078B137_STYLE|nr:exodeoxyribonuclease iii family protein [Stylonychia lemnae]|eukprot:CDW88041.1 exodeoxyribonuclease iii family protein [Stylonychia lemnae]